VHQGFHEFGTFALGLKGRFVNELDLDSLLNDSLKKRWTRVVGVFPPCHSCSLFGAVELSRYGMDGDREHPFQGAKSELLGRLRGHVRVISEL